MALAGCRCGGGCRPMLWGQQWCIPAATASPVVVGGLCQLLRVWHWEIQMLAATVGQHWDKGTSSHFRSKHCGHRCQLLLLAWGQGWQTLAHPFEVLIKHNSQYVCGEALMWHFFQVYQVEMAKLWWLEKKTPGPWELYSLPLNRAHFTGTWGKKTKKIIMIEKDYRILTITLPSLFVDG